MNFKIVDTHKKERPLKEIIPLLTRATEDMSISEEDRGVARSIFDDFNVSNFDILTDQEIEYLTHIPKEKWAEYLIFRYKFHHYSRKKIRPEFPLYLLVEPASVCNLSCRMCWHSDKSFGKNKEYLGFMKMDLYKKVIDEAVAKGSKALTMASRGEPTLNPKFEEMLDYSAGKFLEIKINTNAVKLSDKVIHSILKNNIHFVVFSIDAYTRSDYLEIRRKDCFDKVIKNIDRFNIIRKQQYSDSKTITRIHGIRAKENLDDKTFIEFWSSRCDQVSIGTCDQRWDIYNNEKHERSDACPVLYDRMYVWYDGTCNPCDPDYKSKLCVGSVSNQTISEVWNGEGYELLLKAHSSKERSRFVPCDRCDI